MEKENKSPAENKTIKINFNFKVKGLDRKETPIDVPKAVANALGAQKTEDPVGNFILAEKIYESKGAIEVTPTQLKQIEDALKKSSYIDIVVAQILMKITKEK